MLKILRRLVMVLAMAVSVAPMTSARAGSTVSCEAADDLRLVSGGADCFALLSFGTAGMRPGGTLVVFLHGDYSRGGPADGFRKVADKVTAPGRMAVVLIRQGYEDSDGRRSTGSNYDRKDNATAGNVDNIGAALERLKSHHRAGRLVVIGHSRGSNITAVLVGRRPGLIDAAVLFSCPCDLALRQERRDAARNRVSGPYRSLSPLDFVAGIPDTAWIATISGSYDDNTAPDFLVRWHAALERRKLPVRNLILPGEPHNWSRRWFDRPDVQGLLAEAIGG